MSVALALPIRQEGLVCLCCEALLDVCVCQCECFCALHPGILPLSPPDIPLPVAAAWRSQIRPSSTFLLPAVALASIQRPSGLRRSISAIAARRQNKYILSSLRLRAKGTSLLENNGRCCAIVTGRRDGGETHDREETYIWRRECGLRW